MKSWTVILIFVTIATLNAEGQKVYWGDPFTALIERSDIDGSNRKTVIGAGLTSVWGVAIDPSGGKVYWVDRGASTVNRSNDDGTGAEILAKDEVGIN